MPCPCCDEENDGIPKLCLTSKYCPFHPLQPWFAQSTFARMFGNIGLPHFDKKRRKWMGFAFGWTVVSFLFTVYGCLAVFNSYDLIRVSYWASGVSYSGIMPVKGEDFSAVYLGLSGYVFTVCNATTNITFGVDDFAKERPELSRNVVDDYECYENYQHSWGEKGIDQDWSGTCQKACKDTLSTAIMSCIPMIFAMFGAINRMRFVSDCPQQKILGCITDSFGAFSLAVALLNYEYNCYESMDRYDVTIQVDELYDFEFKRMYWWRGGGYWSYWFFCFSGGVVRAMIHWVTPCPGQGVSGLSGLGLRMHSWKLPVIPVNRQSHTHHLSIRSQQDLMNVLKSSCRDGGHVELKANDEAKMMQGGGAV